MVESDGVAKALEDLNLTWLECDIHDPMALATLRRATSTPIASLETVHGIAEFQIGRAHV